MPKNDIARIRTTQLIEQGTSTINAGGKRNFQFNNEYRKTGIVIGNINRKYDKHYDNPRYSAGLAGSVIEHWSFSAVSGTNPVGVRGYALTTAGGLNSGGPGRTSGIIGSGLNFNGTVMVIGTSVDPLHDLLFFDSGTSFTFSTWVYRETSNTAPIISKWTDAGNLRSYLLEWLQPSGAYRFSVSQTGFPADATITADQQSGPSGWDHVIAGLDAANKRIFLYVNGSGVYLADYLPNRVLDTSATFLIGGSNVGVNVWTGRIDETTVFQRALTDRDVSLIYNSGIGRPFPFLSNS